MDSLMDVKKLVRGAGTAISRVVQLTEERLGTSEKTELDAHFENLAERADVTKQWTEKIVANTEAVLTPNPGNRVEDFIYERIEKKKPNRLSNLEYLGLDMIEAGNEFGPGTSYGSTLIKVGNCQQRLGQTERDFIGSAYISFVQPLKKFLEGEMKTIQKERSLLETKRLDLDAYKSRVRKAHSLIGQQSKDGISPEAMLDQAERDLRVAQSEFDRQAEITKLLLEGVSSSRAGHLRCLHEYVETQAHYYAECHNIMQNLQKELTSSKSTGSDFISTAGPELSPSISPTSPAKFVGDKVPQTRARVLYDYEAKDETELNLISDEVLFVQDIADEDYLMGYRNGQRGRVPKAFLEILLT